MAMKTGEDYRRAKELEEARKAGLAPAAVDEETGKEINPHIPQYMTTAPWYMNSDKPTLKHQKNWKEKGEGASEWYERGVKTFQATKYRKGACENCGAMTHKTKDCLERPRQKGAKWTNKNIAADEKVHDMKITGWDAKRDRWNGFDATEYEKVVDRYERLEEIRKEMKKKEQLDKIISGQTAEPAGADDHREGDDDFDEEDVKLGDDKEAAFGEVKKRVRTTAGGATGSVRNLRIREDIAKYLLNLDPNSAHYDPKSRSMREDPNPDKPLEEKLFAGENFLHKGGDYAVWQDMTVHAVQSYDKGVEVHMQANPSLAELMYKQFKERKQQLEKTTQEDVLSKYGNVAEKMPEDLKALQATERYVEYDRQGRVIKGQEVKVKSRYEEDVYINNHTSVWGSWWKDGMWGYACCHSHVKNSFCTGKAGEQAEEQMAEQMIANMEAKATQKAEEDMQKRKESKLNDYKGPAELWGDYSGEQLDDQKVQEALKKLEAADKAALSADGSKRKYNSLSAANEDLTPEEMEAYRIKKSRGDDPMAAFAAGSAGAGGYDFL